MNKTKQKFGGDWTEEKLNCLKKYLDAYMTALKNQPFALYYIDAFAGTGYRTLNDVEEPEFEQMNLFGQTDSGKSSKKESDGSARIALKTKPPFHQYIFIEQSTRKIKELNGLRNEFSELADKIEIHKKDANTYLNELAYRGSDFWKSRRAVLFLDPFGMQVPWSTIENLARTEAVDLWYLFPLGIAVNRLLKKDGNINERNIKKLNEIFGTTDWYDLFYEARESSDLFCTKRILNKTADCRAIGDYFVERLRTVFPGVADNPRWLTNSFNSNLYLLCFACANKNGSKPALRIAQHILNSA